MCVCEHVCLWFKLLNAKNLKQKITNAKAVQPGTFPIEAIDSTNASKAGNGDIPEKYVLGKSLL